MNYKTAYWDSDAGVMRERDFTPEEVAEIEARMTPDLDKLRAEKNEQINSWRAAANLTSFPYLGKTIACDALSRSDIDGVANNIGLFGTFPDNFPGGWKAIDNSTIPMPTIANFKAMYAAMTAQGSTNFKRAQILKAQLSAAKTSDDIAAITW